MNFKEAFEAIKEGKKVTRPSYRFTHFCMKDKDLIHNSLQAENYHLSADIISSDEKWEIIGEDIICSFFDLIDHLRMGKKAKLPHWQDKWIVLGEDKQNIYFYSYLGYYNYFFTMEEITATDWEIIE